MARTLASQRVKAFDGVTTALEMEIGAPDVAQFLQVQGRPFADPLRHHRQPCRRSRADFRRAADRSTGPHAGIPEILPKSGPATDQPATPEQIEHIQQRLRDELDAGALGIGMGIQYTPEPRALKSSTCSASPPNANCLSTRTCAAAGRLEPGSAIEAVEEVIGAAAITGAPLHIVHINSTCLRDSLECLSLVAGARARGLDVTTEAYPYIAGMTAINSALFNPGWREKLGIDYSNLVLPDTGEHLTKERFDELHNSSKTAMGADLRQYAGDRRRHHSQPADHDRQRRSAKAIRAMPEPSRACWRNMSAKKDAHADGSAPQNDADARADAGAIHPRRPAERPPAGRRRRRHRSLRSRKPSPTGRHSKSQWSPVWACIICWWRERP